MDSYPLHKVEVVFHALAGMSVFRKIDLKMSYHQIPVDNNFKDVTTINMPMGLLKWKRMPHGIKTVSAISYRAIEQVQEDIKNMVCYQDDICIGATNQNELKKKTDIILNRLRNTGITINEKKYVNDSSKISFLGYTISKEGISPDKALIEKVLKIATPTNKKELESFLGLVNFYRRYVPKYTDLTELYVNLRKKNVEFIWSEKQQKALDRLKVIMTKKPLVKVFEPKKDITLTTDASKHSLSEILSQEGHPIMYLLRRLMNTEFN